MTAEQEQEKFERILRKLQLGDRTTDAELRFFVAAAEHTATIYAKSTSYILRLGATQLHLMAEQARGYLRARGERQMSEAALKKLADKIQQTC